MLADSEFRSGNTTSDGVSYRHPIYFREVPSSSRTRRYARLYQEKRGGVTDVTKWVAFTFEWRGLRRYFKETTDGWVAVLPRRQTKLLHQQLSEAISYCVQGRTEITELPRENLMDKHHTLSGAMVCRLMRTHRVTIAGLAAKHRITQKRVREVRAKGVSGFSALEWVFLISGAWPDKPVVAANA